MPTCAWVRGGGSSREGLGARRPQRVPREGRRNNFKWYASRAWAARRGEGVGEGEEAVDEEEDGGHELLELELRGVHGEEDVGEGEEDEGVEDDGGVGRGDLHRRP